jgi:hypothetical protein
LLQLSGAVVSTRMKTFSQTKLKTVNGKNPRKPRKAPLCEQYAELLRLRQEIELLSASGTESKKPLRTPEGELSVTNPQD